MSEAMQARMRLTVFRLFIIGTIAFISFLFLSSPWPPVWVERHHQRQKVTERVQSAGGWGALKRDCLSLTETNEAFRWGNWRDNSFALPPTLAALRPQEIDYVSPKLLTPRPEKPQAQVVRTFQSDAGGFVVPEIPLFLSNKVEVAVVRIKIFGAHSTGGHSIPYFGLEIISWPGSEDYRPRACPAASGNGHLSYRKIEEGIYEIY
jgi:hypothetical protein